MPDYQTNSPEETFNLGKQISQKLKLGSVVALSGELGSGKTCFTKGIAEGLGIKECITSPTYTIINNYEFYLAPNETELNRITYSLFHIDTYRLNNEREFEEIGGKEILSSNGICIIEWADKIMNLLPSNTILINIQITGTDYRKITIKGDI